MEAIGKTFKNNCAVRGDKITAILLIPNTQNYELAAQNARS